MAEEHCRINPTRMELLKLKDREKKKKKKKLALKVIVYLKKTMFN